MNVRLLILLMIVAAIVSVTENKVEAEVRSARSGVRSHSGLTPNSSQRTINQGNLIVTGNVAGNKYFRGIVPYRSTSEFSGTVPSATLNSFYRRSAGGSFRNSSKKALSPYYLPSQTVTSIKRGQGSGLQSPPFRINPGTGTAYIDPEGHSDVSQATQDKAILSKTDQLAEYMKRRYSYSRARPLAAEVKELEAFEMSQLQKQLTSSALSKALSNNGKDSIFRRDLEKLTQTQRQDNKVSDSNTPVEPHNRIARSAESPEPYKMQSWIKENEQGQAVSVFEHMQQLLDETSDQTEELRVEPEKTIGDEDKLALRRDELNESVMERARARRRRQTQSRREEIHAAVRKDSTKKAQDRFDEYMISAEDLMKQGKYYRAADAYTLASIYIEENPLAYAGKAHALLAAGEYMSSTYFLSKALELFPDYVEFKIDLAFMIGDRKVLDERVADLEQWQQKSGSGQLQLLLAYVYYQTDRLADAKRTIDESAKKLPDSFAAGVLKEAIEKGR